MVQIRNEMYKSVEKKILRGKYLEQRKQMDVEDVNRKSNIVCKQLFEQRVWIEAKKIHCYKSIGNEVSTVKVLEEAKRLGKEIIVPEEHLYKVEPAYVRQYQDKGIDLVICPGVVFDLELNRLGRGKGFYDILLSQLGTYAVGLAYEEQIVKGEYLFSPEGHDIPMDMLVTEEYIYRNLHWRKERDESESS